MMRPMDIAIVVFPQLTALDALGPYQVLTRLPGAEVLLRGRAARRGA